MDIRTFRASSLQDALRQVRETLGSNASVLHTREVRKNRFGLFSKSTFEVEASVDIQVASRFAIESPRDATRSMPPPTSADSTPLTAPSQIHVASKQPQPDAAGNPANQSGTASHSDPQVTPTRSTHRTSAQHHFIVGQPDPTMDDAALEVLSELVEAGVEPALAKHLLLEAAERCGPVQQHDPWLLKVSVIQSVAKRLNVGGSIEIDSDEQKVVALVGSTGVGKTTTLAKIAAGLRFDLGCQVGLITLDTFRLGAVDQLLQYAELISAPLEVVSSPDQVTPALARLRECDLVLLDTAGRAPRDTQQLLVLNEFLHAAQPDATHLVLSASSSSQHIRDTIEQFSLVRPTNMLITKLDEAVGFGAWLPFLFESKLPVSYLTTGQHVPQDIVVPNQRRLARDLVGHDSTERELRTEPLSNAY